MKRILILEDNTSLGQAYTEILTEAGFEIRWAKNSTEAENTVESFPADLLIIDHNLRHSEKHGAEVLPILKKKCPRAKSVICSNYDKSEIISEVANIKIDDYWLKLDIDKDKLLSRVKELLA